MDQQILTKLAGHFGDASTKKYSKGQILTFAGQDPQGVSLLIGGLVEQYDITPEGNKIVVNVFKPPAFFPMSWAINRTPNSFFYAALTDVELKQADAEKTVRFLKSNPDVMFDLLSRVYKGTDGLLRRLVIAASGIAANRLVFELLIEAYRFGVEQKPGVWVVNVQQNVLAARSGLARETVSRELGKLENENLVSRDKRGMSISVALLEQKLNLSI